MVAHQSSKITGTNNGMELVFIQGVQLQFRENHVKYGFFRVLIMGISYTFSNIIWVNYEYFFFDSDTLFKQKVIKNIRNKKYKIYLEYF